MCSCAFLAVCPKSRERVVFITEEVSDMVDPYYVYFFTITTNENSETSWSKEVWQHAFN